MGTMRLLSVNVGRRQIIHNAGKSGETGIYKRPSSEPVRITQAGLAGDEILDTKNHGGPDQAVYVYGSPDYEWWSEELGRELSPGTFGENLTIAGLVSAGSCIGDRFCVGGVVLEVTAPRIPCATLAARMGDPKFVKRFRRAGRPGLYCRVIQEGWARAGDAVAFQRYEGERVSAIEVFRDFFEPDPDEATIRRHLAAPIAIRARVEKEKQLARTLQRENSETRLLISEQGE